MASDAHDDARANRRYWDGYSDEYQADHGAHLAQELVWGTWAVPERELGILGAVADLDVLELGCGAAQWSIFLAGQGARVVALDTSERQLGHAVALQGEHRVAFPLVLASAAAVPLADRTFDLVLSDHGAMSYADPDDTLPEVHRLLRPGGRLVFNTFTPFASVCWNEETGRNDETLHRSYFAPARWADDNGFVSFELGYGDWIRALRRHGFVVDDLRELRPAADATSSHHGPRDRAWARRWPAEQVWSVHAPPRA